MELNPGVLLHNGIYRILGTLGQGGFGITYLAIDTRFDIKVAIKEFFPQTFCGRTGGSHEMRPSTDSNEALVIELRRKFFKEASNLAKFNHRNIVRVMDLFEENGTAYFVMDYIPGKTLEQYVNEKGLLPSGEAVRLIREVAAALEYIHAHSVNHLDVKPANIILRADGNVPVLVDFGLAKHYDSSGNQTSHTPSGMSKGFAAIEQYREGGVSRFSPTVDIYSLGATFYYMLTGKVPPSAVELINTGLTFPLGFPEQYRRIIMKAMAPVQMARYQSIGAFLADLGQPSAQNPHALDAGNDNTRIIKNDNIRSGNGLKTGLIIAASVIVAIGLCVGLYSGFPGDKKHSDQPVETAMSDTPVTNDTDISDTPTAVQMQEQRQAQDAALAKEKEDDFKSQLPLTFRGTGIDENGNDCSVSVKLKTRGKCSLEINADGDVTYLGSFSKNGSGISFNFSHWQGWDYDSERIVTDPLPSSESRMRSCSGTISVNMQVLTIYLPEYGECTLYR